MNQDQNQRQKPIFDSLFERVRSNNIIFALLAVFVAFLAYKLALVLVILFIAFVLTIVMLPLVEYMTKRRIPRALAVLLVSVGMTVLLLGIAYLLIPPLVEQFRALFQRLPEIISEIPFLSGFNLGASISNLIQTIVTKFSSTVLSFTQAILSFVVAIISIVVINIYLLADYPRIKRFLTRQFGSYEKEANHALDNMEHRIGGWLRGQLLLMLSIGVIFFIAYSIIGLPSALPLALLAGIFEIIPVVGPLIAFIPAILLAFTVSLKTAIVVLIVFLAVQQLENHILAPKIMSRTAELHPLAVILALLVGGQLAGFLGLLLAVPLLLFLLSLYDAIKERTSKDKPNESNANTQNKSSLLQKVLSYFN